MRVPADGDHGFDWGMLVNDVTEGLFKDGCTLFAHIGDDDVEAAIPAFLAALPSYAGERVLPVGTVLRTGSTPPPDGTPLLLGDGSVERYDGDLTWVQFDGWTRYAERFGPFVVVPNFDALVNE